MPALMFHVHNSKHNKRSLFRWNVGGEEHNNIITGNQNELHVTSPLKNQNDETLLRKAGTEFGKVLEGGADLVVSPAKWLAHMQENWLYYLIFGTIFLVCVLIIYCFVRNKIAQCNSISTTNTNRSRAAVMEAMELAALRQSLPEI